MQINENKFKGNIAFRHHRHSKITELFCDSMSYFFLSYKSLNFLTEHYINHVIHWFTDDTRDIVNAYACHVQLKVMMNKHDITSLHLFSTHPLPTKFFPYANADSNWLWGNRIKLIIQLINTYLTLI